MSYNTKVYSEQGGDVLVVADGGAITIEDGGALNFESGGELAIASGAEISIASGGKITAAGTQALTIANAKADYTALDLDTEAEIIVAVNLQATKINAIIAALKGVGIIAAS